MHVHYNPILVLISIAVAIVASYVALDVSWRLNRTRGYPRHAWLVCGSFAMGVGIWSMHFIGMLAFHLPVPVHYDGPLVVVSVLVAVLASALALSIASRAVLPFGVIVGASLLMGGAINGMHYIGMAAMRLSAVVTWRPLLVVASIVIAVTASFLALLLAFKLRDSGKGVFRWRRLWAAMVMGIAISGMHYTGMAAARFTPATISVGPGLLTFHSTGLTIAVIASTVLILSVALAAAAFDERTRLLTREQRARHDAEVASRLKDEFLATLSHELRTPLNVIVGRAQMLGGMAGDPEKVRQAAETITRNGETLTRMVEDLLDVSRITLGAVHLDWKPVDFAALVEAAGAGIRPTAEAKGIRFFVKVDRQIGRLTGDQTRLQQVVWNLFTNAIKFTPQGGEICTELSSDGSQVVLTVSDTGQGIDPAFAPFVFDMFRQADATSNRIHGGLGIGLSIVRRLVELHGGTVSAASPGAGRGATFTVSLPYPPSAATDFAAWKQSRRAPAITRAASSG
jgi:signal transduction histidine kinase